MLVKQARERRILYDRTYVKCKKKKKYNKTVNIRKKKQTHK